MDASLARLTVGLVLPAVVYLCEVYEERTDTNSEAPTTTATPITDDIRVGSIVRYSTFGEGQVLRIGSTDSRGLVLEVDFGVEFGVKRFLSAYAPVSMVRL